ncbi:MAG TPA: sigma 54-interacting transcriptional regulator, partial [Bacillales bacterium]|nr:sigma 54-interacting transcriptional regulator [Bacillales bacterium]
MKVGPKGRSVIVNVAPVIVNGKLKGSVGILHDVSEIQALTEELNDARRIIRTLRAKYSFADITGSSSEEMRKVVNLAETAAPTSVTILLMGESGTGKELFAHAIHNASGRMNKKFVRVNCAALSDSLLESELFGYEEGAFSGAKRGGKTGLFEEANGGSIFLDEIGELSPGTQAKLLRVLQENEIIRVGGTKPVTIDVRVIAATNVDLEARMSEGKFRKDLYYRINKMPIHIPPLRQRKQDLPNLCKHLIAKLNIEYGRNVEGITEEALSHLEQYDWPGNVRELENVLGRAIIHMEFHASRIEVHHIPPLGMNQKPGIDIYLAEDKNSITLADKVALFEREVISKALKANGGNKTKTAQALNVSIRNLYYKMEKYDLA